MTCEQYLMKYRDTLDAVAMVDDRILEEKLVARHVVATYAGDKISSGGSSGHGGVEDHALRVAELEAKKEKLISDANQWREDIAKFIQSVGDIDFMGQRYRKILKLYYVDLVSWTEIRTLLRPTIMRDGRMQVNVGRKRGISETHMFRLRSDALAIADREFRAQNLGSY